MRTIGSPVFLNLLIVRKQITSISFRYFFSNSSIQKRDFFNIASVSVVHIHLKETIEVYVFMLLTKNCSKNIKLSCYTVKNWNKKNTYSFIINTFMN